MTESDSTFGQSTVPHSAVSGSVVGALSTSHLDHVEFESLSL